MLKKVPVLVVTLALLLAASQLALAQQATDTTQQQAPPSPDQTTGEAQPSQPSTNPFVQLNENNELVVDCQALSDGLAQLQQEGTPQPTDPQAQSALEQAQGLLQLCEASGFTPAGSGGTVPAGTVPAGTVPAGGSTPTQV